MSNIMKQKLLISFFITANILFAQSKDESKYFSRFEFGLYSGFNFETFSESGGDYIAEVKTNLGIAFNLKISVGYSKIYKSESYTVRTYSEISSEERSVYQAQLYKVGKKDYDFFTAALGFQYLFGNKSNFEPYAFFDLCYNNITNVKNVILPPTIWTYSTFDDLPSDFKIKHNEKIPAESYGASVGIGTTYKISSKFNLDLRYFYKIDNEIINTHHFIAGVFF